jgi:tryptophanase
MSGKILTRDEITHVNGQLMAGAVMLGKSGGSAMSDKALAALFDHDEAWRALVKELADKLEEAVRDYAQHASLYYTQQLVARAREVANG